MSHGDDGLPHMSAPSKAKSMRRTMSVRLGTENKLALGTPTNSLSNETPDIRTSVLFKLASPTTGRILHRTIVSGMLTSLTAAQVANTCLAGASAFSALAGAGESLNIDESHLGAFSIANSEGKINPSPHPSMAVEILEHATEPPEVGYNPCAPEAQFTDCTPHSLGSGAPRPHACRGRGDRCHPAASAWICAKCV